MTALLSIATQTSGSPFYQQDPAKLTVAGGRVRAKDGAANSGVPYLEILKLAKLPEVIGKAPAVGLAPEARNYSMHSFGAQFVEVEWDPGIAHLRGTRAVSVIDGGRIINLKTATNQVAGAVVMGIGMALMEQTVYDPRNGHPVNDNYADYLVPTHADSPSIDVHFLNKAMQRGQAARERPDSTVRRCGPATGFADSAIGW